MIGLFLRHRGKGAMPTAELYKISNNNDISKWTIDNG